MTNKEKELMQDLINQASNKVELLQKIVIEKAVELERLKEDAHNLITKQEQEIAELKAAKNDWKQRYESLDQRYMALVASSVECMDKKVKKAKIDVLNELKLLSIYDFNYMDSYVLVDDIDKMIAEV